MPDAPGRRRAILDELCGTERENGTSLWYGSVDNADRSAPNARLYLSMGFIAHTMTCSFPRTLSYSAADYRPTPVLKGKVDGLAERGNFSLFGMVVM